MIFDTHAHYDDDAFKEDRDVLLNSLQVNGIERVVNVGSSLSTCKSTLTLLNQYAFIYGALGVHPSETAELNRKSIEWLEENCKIDKCVAVGEIGLDYYWPEPDREIQKRWFREQIRMAKRLALPVIIHSREAAQDTMDIMREERCEEIGGVIHCFSYSPEVGKYFMEQGFYIGIGGVVTFKNARKLKESVEAVSIDKIVLETDCPYLAPEPHRGFRNSSLNLPYVITRIAQIKHMSVDEVEKITWENAMKLYRM